jgi:hypothetical protein
MICQIVVKCATLIAVIHGLRILGRRIGPRASGLILGLPSSTAILLVLCGRERGADCALAMADASLLGLIAAVALPMAYALAVRRGWRLPAALAAAIAAYVVVASGLGSLHPGEPLERLVISCGAILVASHLAARIGGPKPVAPHPFPSSRWAALSRTIVPLAYVMVVGIVSSVANPNWAGLVGTFPGISTVILAVTHLEEGAEPASRIARALPPANLSTAAFLAAFRFGCPALGLGWGTLLGYGAALINLAAMERLPGWLRKRPPLHRSDRPVPGTEAIWMRASRAFRYRFRIDFHPAPRRVGRMRAPHRRQFAPGVEILPC